MTELKVVDMPSFPRSLPMPGRHAEVIVALVALAPGKCLQLPSMGLAEYKHYRSNLCAALQRAHPKLRLHMRRLPLASYAWVSRREI